MNYRKRLATDTLDNQQSSGTKRRSFYGYVIVAAGFLITLIAIGTIRTFGIFLKPMSTELNWSRGMASGAYSTFMLFTGLFSIMTGRINDKLGPRLVLTACGLLSGLGYLLVSQTTALWQLYLFYGVVISLASSCTYVPLLSTVAKWFTKRRNTMTGIVASGLGFGTVVMSPLAGWLMTNYDWRTSFVVLGSIALVFITLLAQLLRRDPGQIGALPYGESGVSSEKVNQQLRGLSLQQAIQSPQLWKVCALFSCHLFGQQIILVHIVPYATDLGISTTIAANILTTIGALSIVGIITMSSVADRLGIRPALIIDFVVVSIALIWLLFAREIWMLYLFAAVFGFGFGGTVVQQSPIVAELFGLKSHGTLFGIVMSGAMAAGALGAFAGGMIFDVTGSYQVAFIISIALSIFGLLLAISLRTVRGHSSIVEA